MRKKNAIRGLAAGVLVLGLSMGIDPCGKSDPCEGMTYCYQLREAAEAACEAPIPCPDCVDTTNCPCTYTPLHCLGTPEGVGEGVCGTMMTGKCLTGVGGIPPIIEGPGEP